MEKKYAVGIETAKLLKDAGYIEPCEYVWYSDFEWNNKEMEEKYGREWLGTFVAENGVNDISSIKLTAFSNCMVISGINCKIYAAPLLEAAVEYANSIGNTHITVKPYAIWKGISFAYEVYELSESMAVVEKDSGFESSRAAYESAIRRILEKHIANHKK